MPKSLRPTGLFNFWLIGLIAAIFVGDCLLSSDLNVPFVYVLVFVLVSGFRERNDLILLGAILTTLIIVAPLIKPDSVAVHLEILDRLVPITLVWVATYFTTYIIGLQQKQTEQNQRFRALFEYAAGAILMSDEKGNIILANPAACQMFGYDRNEMLKITVEDLVPRRIINKHTRQRASFFSKPSPRQMGIGLDLWARKANGEEFPVEISLSPYNDNKGRYVIAFVIDISQRKKSEALRERQQEELSKLTQQLQELNTHLEEKVIERTRELENAKIALTEALSKEKELGELKSRFVSMASHEFRTPLTSVLSSADLIKQYVSRNELSKINKHADRIKQAVSSLSMILTDFLSLGRLEEGRIQANLQPLLINESIIEAVEEVSSMLKPGQRIEINNQIAEAVSTDGHFLKYILLNLLSNAIKYSPEDSVINITGITDRNNIEISVADQGMGIPLQDHKHLFELFFRASNAQDSTKGSGLGLYIIKRYVSLLGGTITFFSEVDKGSVFTVRLPKNQ